MNQYIINGEIEFIPEDNKLISRQNPEMSATLTTPSSRCLILLLENTPQIVSHDELLKRVWGENGMVVPLNTLHQSISIIRKGLRKVHPIDSEIIKSIPGKGFKVLAKVDVINIDNTEIHVTPPLLIKSKFSARVRNIKSMATFSILGIVISGCAYTFFDKKISEINLHDNYRLNITKTGCQTYSNARFNYDTIKQNDIRNIIKNAGFTCNEYPLEYISTYKASSVSSVIKCKKPLTTRLKDNCISFYFRDGV